MEQDAHVRFSPVSNFASIMSAGDVSKPLDASISVEDGRKYWEGVDADINGMLGGVPTAGGFSYISKVDLQGSRGFLAKLGIGNKNGRRKVANALEGGAGSVFYDGYRSKDRTVANQSRDIE